MLEKLISLLGKSIESDEIKSLFTELGFGYPSKTTCTANNDSIKGKFEKDGIRLYFGRGANSRYLKPILGKTKGSFIGIFYMVEFTKKCKDGVMPLGVKYAMKPEELTAILGEPKVVNFMGTTSTWRKNVSDKHELIVSDVSSDSGFLRGITLSFIYEQDLYSMEEYEKAEL
jgi:hypothetical protein